MQEFDIPAGTRTRIYRRYSNSLPETIRFYASSISGAPSGIIEVEGPPLRKKRPPQALAAQNVVDKSMWDSKFSIFVTPDADSTVTVHKRVADGVPRLVWLLSGVVALAVVAAVIPLLF